MAIKTFDEIVEIIKAGKPSWVTEAIEEHERLEVHFNGDDTDKYLKAIDTIENPKQYALRKKFLTTNRHAFHILSRPIDKVFSAKGGSRLLNLSIESQEKTLLPKLSNVRHGKNIRQWIKDIQSNKYYTDPSGLVFFEWNDKDTWPTLKSIECIWNYESSGRTLEWVLFEPKKGSDDTLYFRFVDDSTDYLIAKKNDLFTIIEEKSFKNPFGKVPAIINSEIINPDLEYFESPFEIVVSLADHYLRTTSIKNLNEFLHGYPIFWRYASDCKNCKGTGYVEGKECPTCSGTGKNLNKDITDIINLERPSTNEEPVLAPDVAGYVTPDVVSQQEMRTEQNELMSLMELTMWGSKMSKDANNETATAAFLDVQPVNDRLNGFSDAYEDLEKKMIDLIGKFYLKTDVSCSVSYGRRYLVESPDQIWKKYQEARKEGINKISLDYLLKQFYQTEYSNDIQSLVIAEKSIKLEPYIHKTDEELNLLPLSEDEKKRKFYFHEWFKTLSEMEILTMDIQKLNSNFEQYLTTKTIVNGTTQNV